MPVHSSELSMEVTRLILIYTLVSIHNTVYDLTVDVLFFVLRSSCFLLFQLISGHGRRSFTNKEIVVSILSTYPFTDEFLDFLFGNRSVILLLSTDLDVSFMRTKNQS